MHIPVSTDLICTWGEVDRDWFLAHGTPPERVAVTGSPRVSLIAPNLRAAMRLQYHIETDERVVLFFAPNLTEAYHQTAAAFLTEARRQVRVPTRWLIRLHPSQRQSYFDCYASFESLPTNLKFEHALAVSDLALHDYSTMAEAQYAGVKVGCLQLDAPYPLDFPTLLGDQFTLSSVHDLVQVVEELIPGYTFRTRPGPTLKAGNEEAVAQIGKLIIQMIS
jgi:hypothetical protein